MRIVQQVEIVAVRLAYLPEEFRGMAQIQGGIPGLFRWQTFLGRLVIAGALAYAVDLLEARHARLDADRLETLREVAAHRFDRLGVVVPVGMSVHHCAGTTPPAEQLIH